MDSSLPFETTSKRCILFLLLTIPLLFGATHPFVQGLYTLYLLFGVGSWLLFVRAGLRFRSSRSRRHRSSSRSSHGSSSQDWLVERVEVSRKVSNHYQPIFSIWLWPALVLLAYIALTTLPLPLGLLDIISPVRGRYLAAVNALA
ncbi:MAG: hypothetical protein KAG92_06320, partial [Deltaproteobacteria bacterium]|nr:hypothetical protein [Deltaproteobacteria bacterium]